MRGRVPLARRTLFQDRRRAVLATVGIAASLLLVLLLDGVFAGDIDQSTAYLRSSPADVIVSQQGVRTMHMSESALTPQTVDVARRASGVAWAAGIRFTSTVVRSAGSESFTYVIGYDTATGLGGPQLVAGRAPGAGEVVLDRVGADVLGVDVGAHVTVLGQAFVVSGLSSGGTSIINTTTFVPAETFTQQRGDAVSYVLVGARPDVDADTLARTLAATLPAATVQTRAEFVASEASITRDMSADILWIMSIIGFLIALAVVGLSLYSLTLAKLRDYAVVKALGAQNRRLALTVAAQALWSIGLGLATALVLSWVVGAGIGRLSPVVEVVVEPASVLRAALGALLVGAIGAAIPLRRVARVDPASVFRRSS